jgi:hypothetical protein
MDRDVVNALHFLYQRGETKLTDLLAMLWCGPDSEPDIKDFTEKTDDRVRLSQHLIKFIKAVEGQLTNLPSPDFVFGFPLSEPPRSQGEPRPAFVAMPYGPAWFQPVRDIVVTTASAAGFKAEVSKDLARPRSITDQIWQGIRRSDVVVADISGHNPNVFYELGLAHALGKEVIVMVQGAERSPFDISTERFLSYNVADLSSLKVALSQAFNAVSARYKHDETISSRTDA